MIVVSNVSLERKTEAGTSKHQLITFQHRTSRELYEVYTLATHAFMTSTGWRCASDLHEGDIVSGEDVEEARRASLLDEFLENIPNDSEQFELPLDIFVSMSDADVDADDVTLPILRAPKTLRCDAPAPIQVSSHTLDFMFLCHNVVVHPLCGLCWFVGLKRLGDWLHAAGERFLRRVDTTLSQAHFTDL